MGKTLLLLELGLSLWLTIVGDAAANVLKPARMRRTPMLSPAEGR